MVSEVALSKIYSRFPQRSSIHGDAVAVDQPCLLLLSKTVYASTSKRKALSTTVARNTGLNPATTGERGARRCVCSKEHRISSAFLQEVMPGISSERAVRWAFRPPRTTTWDVNEMPWGVLCPASAERHYGHPSCRIVPPWQQDLSLCAPCC